MKPYYVDGRRRIARLNGQSEEMLDKFGAAGLTVNRVKDAMASIGYSNDALHQHDRWESKRTTGRFGP